LPVLITTMSGSSQNCPNDCRFGSETQIAVKARDSIDS
jgi:hypothetical protein